MKIYAIRHSITPLNQERLLNAQIDEPLAPEGIEHAKKAVLPKSVKHIHTSSLQRTKQTADIVNSEAKLPISTHDELKEVHMGSLAGKSWDDLNTSDLKQKHYALEYDYRPFGGESVQEVKTRLKKFLQQINNTQGDFELLIVTHGGIIRLLHFLEHGETRKDIAQVSFEVFDLDKILESL